MTRHSLIRNTAAVAIISVMQSCHTQGPAPVVTEPEDQCLIDLSARHDVMVCCDVDDAFPYSESVAYDPETAIGSRSEADAMVRRYTVKAFVRGTRQEVASGVSLSPEVSLSLPVGKLDIIAWADYVPQGSVSDYYWFTDDFAEMLEHEKADYRADDDYKAAAHGIERVTVAYNTRRISVGLSTVMAKVRLIASDSPASEVGRIRVSFPGGVHSAIDAFSGKVCYSWQGVAYSAFARPDGAEEWLLTEAMMPADADPSGIAICVETFDTDNNILSRIRRIDVPVRRGCITEVRAPFFTTKELDPAPDDPPSGGGIGIDTDFDDSVVIVLKPA